MIAASTPTAISLNASSIDTARAVTFAVDDATKPLVWITGAGGLIGSYLAQTATQFAPSYRVAALTRESLDLTDFAAVKARFQTDKPALIIHCAALSKSPVCQTEPERARLLNVEVTKHLAELAADRAFIFFSTDLVFDGRKGNYIESDAVNPLSVYGETKATAERIVLQNPRHTVIRTSLNGGISPTGDRGFNEETRRTWQASKTTKLFTDEYRNPIAAALTAQTVWELAQKQATGIFHVAGRERLSRWEIGQLLATRWPDVTAKLEPSSLAEYQGAPRPPDCSLNCAKAQALLSFPLLGLGEWLRVNPQASF